MTNVKAIHGVGDSLESYLKATWEANGPALTGLPSCNIVLLSSGEIATSTDALPMPTLSLYLFRVTMNEHLRNTARPGGPDVPLSLDLHYLLTVWANQAQQEHTLLGWAMRELYLRPVLDGSVLKSSADWSPGEVIQIIPAELTTSEIMEVWDSLEPSYRLSVSYIARAVRISPDVSQPGRPVVASRFSFRDGVEP